MTREEVKKEVIVIVREISGVDDIDENMSFEDLCFDSLDAVETLINTEKVFDVDIEDEDFEKFSGSSSVANVIDCIYNKINN